MTELQKPVSLRSKQSFWRVFDFLIALVFLTGSALLIGELAKLPNSVDWIILLIGLTFATVSGTLLYRTYQSAIRLIEVTPDRLRLYYRHRFLYLDRKDVVAVRLVSEYVQTVGKSNEIILLSLANGKTAVIRLGLFEDPKKVAATLRDWCLPTLLDQATQPPKPVWTDERAFDKSMSIAGVVWFCLFLVPVVVPSLKVASSYLGAFFLVTTAGEIIKNLRIAVFMPDCLFVRGLFGSRTVLLQDITELELKMEGSHETLTVFTNKGKLPPFSSRKRGYLHVRNFLLANCKTANLSGNLDPTSLPFSPFTGYSHNLESNPILVLPNPPVSAAADPEQLQT